jgi:restriction system protein
MAVPGYQDFMLPLLRLAAEGEQSVAGAMERLAEQFRLSEEDQSVRLPSGTQTQFYNRVTWAIVYLSKSMLVEKSGRGRFRIAPRGLEVLQVSPPRIDNAFLLRFPEFVAFKQKKRDVAGSTETGTVEEVADDDPVITPAERLDVAYQELREALVDDVFERVRGTSPKGFERLVVRLLVAMGYGGGKLDRAEVTGRSGDDGIDGVIQEDRLGLDMIYVQAKKWENTVGPGEIDKFVGSLMRKKAHKGVFITSGLFTEGAKRAGREAAVKVRLIDGDELAALMVDFNIGVSDEKSYTVKKIDSDFFDELVV